MKTRPNRAKNIEKSWELSQPSKDVYSEFQDSLDTYFSEIRKNTANYLQSVSDLQEEIIDSRKKTTEKAIDLQKSVYEKMGDKNNIPLAVFDIAKNFAGNATTSWNLQNKLVLDSLATLSRNIEAFNQNSTSFEKINKDLIDYWAAIIKQASKQD